MYIPKEFKPLVPPTYRPAKEGDWEIKLAPPGRHRKVLGYFRNHLPMPAENWVLMQGDRVWMSLTPMELESQGYHARMAYGHVLVAGLGMGALVYNLLKFNRKVTHVTVVDLNPHSGDILTQATDWFRPDPRLTFVVGDALTYHAAQPVDVLLVDIWPRLGEDGAEKDVGAIQSNVHAQEVGWWGQEVDWLTYLNQYSYEPPPTALQATEYQEHLGFKVMAMDHPLYPDLAYVATLFFAASGLSKTSLGLAR